MALTHSTQVPLDGLAFYHDMGNTKKSWKGAPTTNSLTSKDITAWVKENSCTVSILTNETYEGQPIYRVTFAAATLPRVYTTIAYTASQTWSGSIYYRFVSGHLSGESVPQLYFRENSFGVGHNSLLFSSSTEWNKATLTHTFPATPGTNMFLIYRSNSVTTVPIVMDFCMPQYELSSIVTPYTSTSRTSAQAILDLTNKNVMTATSLSYTPTAFTFDGSNSYLRSATNCGITGSVTLSAVVKPSRVGMTGPHSTIICTDTGYPAGAKLMNYKNTARWGIWLGFGGTDNYEALYGADINDNVTKMLTATWNQATGYAYIYLNGSLVTSFNTGKTIPCVLYDGRITLGADYNSISAGPTNKYLGDIPWSAVYSRCLSDVEVKALYNSVKSRFGI